MINKAVLLCCNVPFAYQAEIVIILNVNYRPEYCNLNSTVSFNVSSPNVTANLNGPRIIWTLRDKNKNILEKSTASGRFSKTFSTFLWSISTEGWYYVDMSATNMPKSICGNIPNCIAQGSARLWLSVNFCWCKALFFIEVQF